MVPRNTNVTGKVGRGAGNCLYYTDVTTVCAALPSYGCINKGHLLVTTSLSRLFPFIL